MLIVTAKVPRPRLSLRLAGAVLLCCALVCGLLPPAARQTAAVQSQFKHTRVRDNGDRVDYLAQYGWQVGAEPISIEELKLPEEFDDSYQSYLELQRQQGFDLGDYAGKRVKRYTYEILNYPTGQTGIIAHLLLYKHTVVGGEVLSPELDGFLHGLLFLEE